MKILILAILAFVLLDILLVAYVVLRSWHRKPSAELIGEIQSNWKELIRNADHRHAIMEADKLLDYALGKLGYRGNLGNKLKRSGKRFSDINAVWAAHKVRNNIAHQINFKLDEKTFKRSMLAFKQAFKDLRLFE